MIPSSNEIYKNLAPFYRTYSNKRQAYLDGVDAQIIPYIFDQKTLLDLGTGDGFRILHLLEKSGKKLKKVTLVDSCSEMLNRLKGNKFVEVKKQDFSSKKFALNSKYDVITSLWNVLGHIAGPSVLQALKNIAKHLKKDGVVIIDINNRYNYKQYGTKALKNYFLDKVRKVQTGDISFEFSCNNKKIPSFVHLFSQKEIECLFQKAGFVVKKRLYINYQTGTLEKNQFSGQLFYVLSLKK